MLPFLSALFFIFGCQLTSAAARIGNESTIVVPPSAHYSSTVNVRPGNGEVVSFNPPIFSWFYNTNHWVGGEKNANGFDNTIWEWTNSFNFQVATQADFGGTLLANITTPVNFYNFLAPFPTDATRHFWWRVKYIRNSTPYWTNTYTFTLTNGAVNWDRSMLADQNYLATNGVHPVFCFRAGEQAAIYSWMQNQPEFAILVQLASTCTNEAYFKNHAEWGVNAAPNPTYQVPVPADAFSRVSKLGALLSLWALSSDDRWTNPSMTGWLVTNLSHVVNWYNNPGNNWAMVDFGQPAGSVELPRLVAATYDWMYDYLGANTATFNGKLRANAFSGLQRTMLYYTHNHFWQDSPHVGGAVYRYDWSYPQTTESAPWHGMTKLGMSHAIYNTHQILPLSIVIQQDGGPGAFAFNWMVNYMFARTTPYSGFAAHHVGPYGYTDNHTYNQNLFNALMNLQVTFPQAQAEKIEFARRFPDWWTRMNPYRMRKYHGAFGDGSTSGAGNHSAFLGDKARGFDLAAISGSGLAIQAYDLNAEFRTVGNSPQWHQLPLRYHFRYTPAPETNTTSAVYPEDGYVIASSKSPSEFDCYTNGVGFSFQARPRGCTAGHDIFSDLSFDLWAYGTQLTDGGGMGLDPYCYWSDASPTLFVNGYGYSGNRGNSLYGYSPAAPAVASIVNFTNSGTDFVYCAADGTGLFTNSFHPLNTLVTKVKRHVLFVRSKYWVVHDEFQTKTPATFAFRWHVPWAFRYDANPNALVNETVFSGNRIGSNSLSMGTNGFTYVAGNYADAGFPNPPRIPVHVEFANARSAYGIFNAVGVKDLGLSKTAVVGTSSTNSTLNPFLNRTYATVNPDRAVGMWVTNRIPSTQWNFTTVIVPQQPGVAAPVFQRIDDNTITVTYDGVTETTTFGTNYTGPSTFMVDLDVKLGPKAPTYRGGPPNIRL